MPTPDEELRDKLAAIVDRELKKAHADILKDLARAELEIQTLKARQEDLVTSLAIATQELNEARGIRYDENGVKA